MHLLPEAFAPMAAYRQFIIWRAEWDGSKNKYQKKPVNPYTGYNHNPHDPAIWLDHDTAIQTAGLFGEEFGVGFVFTTGDPFWFLDIDNAATGGVWSDLAQNLLGMFNGAAVELSYSGTGLHIFGTGVVPDHGCKNIPLDLEFYTQERFVALTGNQAQGNAATDHSVALSQVVPSYFPVTKGNTTGADWTDGPDPEWNGPEDDTALLQKMLASKGSAESVFGGKAGVEALWTADIDKLATAYPDQSGANPFDHSSADAALCQHLAFWTGKDCERMDRLFRQSALYRDKWERENYREPTVMKAVGLCNAVYSSKKKDAPVLTDADSVAPQNPTDTINTTATHKEGLQYLSPDGQVGLFAGCVYVRDIHKAYTPDGSLLTSDRFRATYGGFLFAIDAVNDKISKNAWEVFTESQAVRFPMAHGVCFRPELPAGQIVEEAGRALVNTYVPVETPCEQGDVTPFLNHLRNVFPDARDQEIFISFMAACVQYKGKKFRWAPVLQGAEGNGKSLFSEVLIHILGEKYTHKPNAQELGAGASKFTGWLAHKLFIGIEEIHTGGRREVMDALKPMIADSRIEMQKKGDDQIMMENRANFILCTQHKDAIIKKDTSRRYSIFFTRQQTLQDMIDSGMIEPDGITDTTYFPDLYGWLENGGYAYVHGYLKEYAIPDVFNPATRCVRAPVTSSNEEAITVSLGGVEQEIMEAVEQDLPGFAGGWVSSLALDRLLRARNDHKRIPPAKRRELMESLGYVWHPALHEGRVNTVVPIDAGKPRLYVKKGSIQATSLSQPSQVVDAYVKAQGGTAGTTGATADVFSKK
jgi:hypothetical protein